MFLIVLGVSIVLLLIFSLLEASKTASLAEIPRAHPSSAFTYLWIKWQRFKGTEVEAVNGAFQKFGPVVRLGPKELAINMIDGGVKTVYDGGFHKSEWYLAWKNHGQVSTNHRMPDFKY